MESTALAIKERSVQRRLFTNCAKHIEDILETGHAKESEIRCEHKKLQEITSQLSSLDKVIKDCMIRESDFEEDHLQRELESALQYRERWLKIETKFEIMLKEKPGKSDNKNMKRNFRVPEIKQKKFDGNIKNWLSYWGQFKKIHSDPTIDDDDKYQLLLQTMEEGTEVYALVDSYPQDGVSYQNCIEELQNRYAREELLIEVYVREILKLVLQEKTELIDLYDKLNAHLRALNTLGVSKCAAFILPLVESALPTETLRLWERNKSAGKTTKGPDEVLENLMQFLKAEVESVQRIEIAKNTFNKNEKVEPSASCLLTSTKNNDSKVKTCIWCEKDSHSSVECYKLAKMSIEERRNHIKKVNACSICLRKGHYFKTCKAFIKCHICGRRHTVAMCPGKEEKPKEKSQEKPQAVQDNVQTASKPTPHHQTTTNLSSQGTQTLLQTVAVRIRNGNRSVIVRALFDNGSQRSYIKEGTIKKLGIESKKSENLKQCLFGGVTMEAKKHNVYDVEVENLDGKYRMELEALGQNTICGQLDKLQVTRHVRQMLFKHSILLSDIESCDDEVELLIGADYSGLLMTSGLVNLENGMMAINTKLGWTIQGRQIGGTSDYVTSMFCVSKVNLTDLWSLETLGILDSAEQKTKVELEAETLASFEKTILKEEDGIYQVQLPFKVGNEDLLPNYDKAKQRLDSTTRKLISGGKFHEYDAVFKEWLALKIIETVPSLNQERNTGHFLPHKAVIKKSSLTSTLRPVFDASAPDRNGLCLNNCLDKGLNFIENIPNLLIGFRKGAIGITGDIAKAFLQISIPPADRSYLKFLWWEDDTLQQVVVYRHCRVVFGLTSSPFLLAATLKHHLSQVTGKWEKTAQLLGKSFYVDNCVTSMDTEEETRRFIEESKDIMKAAQFNLRMWVTSPLSINEAGKQTVSVLGLNWDTVTDELSCNTVTLPPLSAQSKITKRIVLSLTQMIFDPVGITCPVTLPPKLLLRETWRRGITWDEALPEDLAGDFKKWYVHTHYLQQCKIPRRLTAENIDECSLSLHMFSDASKNAVGACIFLGAEKDNNVTVRLVAAKSRVAPPKNVSIPRLELMAAVIGVRLLVGAKKSLQLSKCKEYCWTDSSVTMYWICKDLTWNTFVGNRVREIKGHTKIENWYHISGMLNWADIASRGCNAKQLVELRWIQGPPFLLSSPREWPESSIIVDKPEAEKELKHATYKVNVCTNEGLSGRLLYFSKYSKMVRMVAWMLRFKSNSLKGGKRTVSKEITGEEYERAEMKIIRLIQQENKEILEENSRSLNTFIDEKNLMRIKTKLLLSNLPEDTKCPIVVSAKNRIVQEMVRQRHVQLQHAGSNMLISDIRKRFWIFGIRRLAKAVISNCMVCKKYRAKPMQAPTAPLPVDRFESSVPFEVTGVDLAGPLFLKNGDKSWIVLYTCAVYRAIHLELTPSLSTEAFIRTFRRFTARRGRASIIYSDNGTNFIGTKNLLEAIDWDEVQKETNMERTKWKLNAPTAAWWGGFWERLVRSIKNLLRRVLGKASVTYDELQTVLCDCEAIMNSRPLTYVQDDKAESLEPLTPASFLQPLPSSETTDLDLIDARSLNIRLKYLQKLREDFRQRFRSEYLAELVQKGKEKGKYKEVNVGQIVLVESEGRRIKWPLGLVTKIFIGKDNVCRTAEVKTSTGVKVRPIQKLYSLEISSDDIGKLHIFSQPKGKEKEIDVSEVSAKVQEQEDKTTRCGRKVRLPSRYN